MNNLMISMPLIHLRCPSAQLYTDARSSLLMPYFFFLEFFLVRLRCLFSCGSADVSTNFRRVQLWCYEFPVCFVLLMTTTKMSCDQYMLFLWVAMATPKGFNRVKTNCPINRILGIILMITSSI